MKNRSILVVCQDFPYPLNYAGPIDSYNKIKALHDAGYKVYLIATVKEGVHSEYFHEISKICSQIFLIYRKYGFRNFLSITPFQISSRTDEIEISEIVSNLGSAEIWSILCDGYYGIGIVASLAQKINPKYIYLRVNNNEPSYFKALSRSTTNIFKKFYYFIDSLKFSMHENILLNRVNIDAFLHVSIEEKSHYQAKFPKKKHYFLPAGIDTTKMLPYERRDHSSVIFIGSLFMPNNLEGLYWYIELVHDRLSLRLTGYKLLIAGNTRGGMDKKLMHLISKRKNITLIDSHAFLDPIYRMGSIFINPMLNGAGVKLKSLNAICAGLPVVSTLIGNEGSGLLDGDHLLVASEPQDFYQKICLLFENEQLRRKLVEQSQHFVQSSYEQSSALKRVMTENEGNFDVV